MGSEKPPPPVVSPDGKFYWDGTQWVPLEDGAGKRQRKGQAESRSLKNWLDLTAPSIGVVTVLLPVEGVVIRWSSFVNAATSEGFHAPIGTLAVSASVPELASTGLAGIWIPLAAFLFGASVAVFPVDEWTFIATRPLARFLAVLLILLGVPIVLSFGILTSPLGTLDWIVASVGFDSGVLAYLWLRKHKVSIVGALALGVGLSIYFALVASMSGNPASVEPLDYQFQAQAGTELPPGRYVALGHADGITYLQSCRDLTFHAVPDAQIVDARFVEHTPSLAQPSVLQMLLHWRGPVFGYRPDCPG